ncbi:Arc family DNA-binding protein [Pseudoduganella violacea]|uniref:Arc family DNA-binding protein n=1 Tax=Pseudoduganella violacea TaxID=1715466 RepID=UPI00161F1452
MQPELRAHLESAAEHSGRSMNAEIVARLEQTFAPQKTSSVPERRKLELVAEYASWCDRHSRDVLKSF